MAAEEIRDRSRVAMATVMMAMMMPAISNRTSDTNTNIKNSLFFSFSLSPLSHQPEYLHRYLVKFSSFSLSLCYPSRFSNSAFLYQIFNTDLPIAAYSYSPLSLKPLSFSSPPPLETTSKATPSDLLSLLGPNRYSRRSSAIIDTKKNPFSIKVGMTQMLRSSAILEVTAVDQAKFAEDAGACAISELRSSVGIAISTKP